MKYIKKFTFFFASSLVFAAYPTLVNASSAISSADPKSLCSNESEKKLAKLSQKGEIRFSEFKFDTESTLVSDVEFTDMGETGRRRRHKKTPQTPAKPEYGKLLTMKALGKEKSGWRNLVVKCGVNKGKIATFTYEILNLSNTETKKIETTATNNTAVSDTH